MKHSGEAPIETSGAPRRRERKRWLPGEEDIAYELWRLLLLYRWRIGMALAFLILAKVATVLVPLILKRIIDQLSRPEQVSLPIYLLAGYALLRFASTLFNELRDLLFSRVKQSTVAAYAQKTFVHLHALGARFHAQRQMGGLLPDIDRGTAGIAFLLGVGLFTLVPTVIEIGMVLSIMLARYSGWFAVIIAFTFLAYGGFTLYFTARRTIYGNETEWQLSPMRTPDLVAGDLQAAALLVAAALPPASGPGSGNSGKAGRDERR